MTIPALDFGYLSGQKPDYKTLAKLFFHTYSTLGFGTIVNHGISRTLIDELFEQMEAFHALPQSTKMKYRYGKYLRGYLPMNISTLKSSTLANVTKPNQSESLMILNEPLVNGAALLNQTPFGGHQIWPKELPKFKEVAEKYYSEVLKLGQHLIRILALALNLEENYFNLFFTEPNIFFRLLYYPPQPLGAEADLYGSAPHTDYGCFTLLLQDDIGGLQVKGPDNTWLDVMTDQYTFILNTGDMIENWSNGILKSTPHRVINKSHNKPRYSVPFFYNCNYETIVKPIDTCITESNPKKFDSVVYGETLSEKIRKNYAFSE